MDNNIFTVLPMSQRITLEPGSTYNGSISVVNPADATTDFSYQVSISPYGVSGEEYTVDLATQYNRSMITDWITIAEPTGTIKPNETKKIEFSIKVPENAPAGGQYATIKVASNNETVEGEGTSVNSVLEIASIIYAKVDGETVHETKVLENNIPGFSTVTPVTIDTLLSNNGNVHEDATIMVTVSDFFTGQVILPTEEESGEYAEVVMPETTYRAKREIDNLPAVGVVKIKQAVYYNGEYSEYENNVILCPIWFMVVAFLVIAAIIAGIVVAVKKHKQNKSAKDVV